MSSGCYQENHSLVIELVLVVLLRGESSVGAKYDEFKSREGHKQRGRGELKLQRVQGFYTPPTPLTASVSTQYKRRKHTSKQHALLLYCRLC